MQGREKVMYKLGIDVGGTNTDAVLIDENLQVAAEIKYPTSEDIYEGIVGARAQGPRGIRRCDRSQIGQAMLGTTQCTNAIVERKSLAPIGILRIGAPATLGIPPMVDWAEDIQKDCSRKRDYRRADLSTTERNWLPFDEEAARQIF